MRDAGIRRTERLMNCCLLLFVFLPSVNAQPAFKAEKTTDHGIDIVRLSDTARDVQMAVVPSFGNRVYELKVHGKNLLYFPFSDPSALERSGTPGLNGIPFLAPWANRISDGGFWAHGKKYAFNPNLGNVKLNSSAIAIHGMLTASPHWVVERIGADSNSAYVTCLLQFWKYPELMANWPFAHEYRMTYSLRGGELEIRTSLTNLSSEAMPVSIGFHPYLNIPGVPRAKWTAHIPARKHVETNKQLLPTGELKENALSDPFSMKGRVFDDGFTDLIRGNQGRADFSVQADSKRIDVIYGPRYQVAVVFAPPAKNFICFEPMAAITNGINLAHEGKYRELQELAPGATWEESFWIRFSGF